MDPLERIHVEGDSTYVCMRECTDRDWPVAMCVPSDLYSRDGHAWARVTPVLTRDSPPFFDVGTPHDVRLSDFDVVWQRKDPPFDMHYIFTTYMLDMAGTLVVNGPAGLKLFNEKMWVQQRWPEFQPPTLVSCDKARLTEWISAEPGLVVLKPWDGNGGRGVVVTSADDRNRGSLVELLSEEGRHYVIAQRFIPEVEQGDKRILLFEGEPVGAILRVPTSGDYRANMHVGAVVQRTELDRRDREICDALRPALVEHDMVFTGIDIIGGYLTEINVTSPTGIREINRLDGVKLEADLVDRVAARAARG